MQQPFSFTASTVFDYYPFGMQMVGRVFSYENGYKYGFNKGSLKDDEIYGDANSYTTEFRELDVRLGKWWSYDPKPKASESPYTSMGDNPLNNNDVFGDIFDPQSQKEVNNFKSNTSKLFAKVNAKIDRKEEKLKSLDPNSKTYDKRSKNLKNTISNLNAMASEFDAALCEVGTLENSDQLYTLKSKNENYGTKTYNFDAKGGVIEQGGTTSYDPNANAIVMEYKMGDLEAEAHELKHGYQFEMGEISFSRNNGEPGALYDATDEMAAFRRGSAFSFSMGQPLLNISYQGLISNGYRSNLIGTQPLNSESTVQDVFKGNPKLIGMPIPPLFNPNDSWKKAASTIEILK